jgi:hypothetical protein
MATLGLGFSDVSDVFEKTKNSVNFSGLDRNLGVFFLFFGVAVTWCHEFSGCLQLCGKVAKQINRLGPDPLLLLK